jgi:hypothetical protein
MAESEQPIHIIAKTCDLRDRRIKKVTYSFVDTYHSIWIDKKDIILSQLEAGEKLLRYTNDEIDRMLLKQKSRDGKLHWILCLYIILTSIYLAK